MSTTTTDASNAHPTLPDAALHAAFERHGAAVLRYARARLGDQLAEDVTAETFVTAWRARNRLDADLGGDLEAWLLGVATNVIARHRRAEARWLRMKLDSQRLTPDRSSADEVLDAIDARVATGEQRANLLRALRRLPGTQRDPLLMHALGDLSYEAIAAALDLPIGTVKSRINRARQRLQQVVDR